MKKTITIALGMFSWAAAQNYTVTLPDSLYTAGTAVTWIKHLPQYCESPLWEPATGAVYFTDQVGNQSLNWPVWKINPAQASDTGSIFLATRQNNGMELDPQGRIVICQDSRIARYTEAGVLDSVLVQSGQNNVTFGQVNDLSIGPNGAIYFTDLNTNVFYLSPSRQLSIAAQNQNSANGIEWLSEQNAVYVNQNNQVTRYTIQANTGALTGGTAFAQLTGPDGGTVDAHGNHWVASYSLGEIHVFNYKGDALGMIQLRFVTGTYDTRAGVQGNTDNCVFGGPGNMTLYMTGDGGLYSVQLKVPGRTLPSTTAIQPMILSPLRKNSALHVVDPLGRKPDLPRQSRGAFAPSLIRIP